MRVERLVAIDNAPYNAFFSGTSNKQTLAIYHSIFKANCSDYKCAAFRGYELVRLFDCHYDDFYNRYDVPYMPDQSCRFNISITYEYRQRSPICPVMPDPPVSKDESNSDKKKKRLAAIIGGTVGGVVLVAVVVAVIYVATRKHGQSTEAENDEPQLEEENNEPHTT
jgi:hypothetical protein